MIAAASSAQGPKDHTTTNIIQNPTNEEDAFDPSAAPTATRSRGHPSSKEEITRLVIAASKEQQTTAIVVEKADDTKNKSSSGLNTVETEEVVVTSNEPGEEQASTGSNSVNDNSSNSDSLEDKEEEEEAFVVDDDEDKQARMEVTPETTQQVKEEDNKDEDDDAVAVATPSPPESPRHTTSANDLNGTAITPKAGSSHHRKAMSDEGAKHADVPDLTTENNSNNSSSHRSLLPPPVTPNKSAAGNTTSTERTKNTSTTTTTRTTTTSSSSIRIPSHAAIKVIKGEIHNVLTMMRATDQRYVSRSRFTEELLPSEAGGGGGGVSSGSGGGSHHTLSGYHPVAQALQDLHAQLTAAVEQGTENELLQNSHVYLEAFCQAIEGQDISAPVTGAALQALHKFVLYGFVVGSGGDNSTGGGGSGMMRIAQALLECRFEESSCSPRSFVSGMPPPSTGSEGHRSVIRRASSGPSSNSSMAYAAAQAAAAYHHHTPTTTSIPYDDEQTVLKLLDVAALTVRTSLQEDTVHLMDATTIVRLLDACLHVSHRAEMASPLLKSAAASALSQIVLQVFAGPGHAPVMEARREILAKLASLLNPQTSRANLQDAASEGAAASSAYRSAKAAAAEKQQQQQQQHQVIVASSLTLVNIALETCREPLTADEIHILQNDLFKYLLQWSSTTHDLMLLSLTLRVIFNLFQSMRNHLKVPLEVFLTSVHLRILNDAGHNYSPEEKEVALESLLEFCQEPALMQDIFLNYDCDMACTNLYESIVTELGRAATPGWRDPNESHEEDDGELLGKEEHVHGGGEVMATPDRKGQSSRTVPKKTSSNESLPTVLSQQAGSEDDTMPPVTHLQRLGVEGLLAVLDSISKRCQEMRRSATNSTHSLESLVDANPVGNEQEDDGSVASFSNEFSPEITSEELHERKRRKHALQKVARAFNAGPMNDSWKKMAVREKILASEASAKSVAEFLLTASHVDKAKLGIYLSKGPDKDYPFNAVVREAFVACYDFKDLTFAAALRKFLSKFRLPGEAQCIDRLMESFSKELHKQRGEDMFFKNSDAIYVLAFSTIMLNTDLHNPTIKEEQRMTKEQFVRNNRGINGGDDLPAEFLEELYDQIKENEIQVRKELGEFMKKHEHEDFRTVWDNMLSKKGEVATPFFTPTGLARSSNRVTAGFHDKEMFVALSKSAVQAFSGIFLRSWDDALVVKALDALRSVARIAAYLGCDSTVTEVLQVLLPQGRDYVLGCIASGQHVVDGASVVSNGPTVSSESLEEDESTLADDAEQPIPYGLLCCNNSEEEVDITGSAAHRGLLALDCSFVLMRKYATRVSGAWPLFVECLCVLRDSRALPAGLSDLDDFADSNGNILPHTSFAKVSRKRLNDYYRSLSEEKDTQASKGWFRSFFRKKSNESDDIPDDVSVNEDVGELSAISRTLLAITEAAGVENVVQLGLARLPDVAITIQTLLDRLDSYPYKGNPVGEQHAIFSLELSARALLSNKDRATELFTPFLDKFESVLGKVSPKKVPAPFVIERIVVTILRCCIHLYDIPELRPNLRAALHLFFISLPRSFIRAISNRMACGLAIILRASFHFFETHNDWTFMGDTLDMLAHYNTSRVFVFDGIASVVEYALPNFDDSRGSVFDDENRPTLSDEACAALSKILIRFVLGFYQGDMSLTIPAILCLEKIYRRRVDILLEQKGADESVDSANAVPDKDYWQNITVAIYSVCRSTNKELSGHGVESFQRLVLQTPVDQISEDKWLDILFLMVSKQPPLSADTSRCNTFSILGELLVRVLPQLSHNEELRDDLIDLIHQVAQLAEENLRQGRRGSVSPLFEKTLQAVTYLSNHMVTDEWDGDSEFGSWASETLFEELERVGAAGATLHNQKAVTQKPKVQKAEANPEPQTKLEEEPNPGPQNESEVKENPPQESEITPSLEVEQKPKLQPAQELSCTASESEEKRPEEESTQEEPSEEVPGSESSLCDNVAELQQ